MGETLRMLREKKKLSLRRVAGLSELTPAGLSNAERDARRITVATLRAIVESGLEMTMSDFWIIVERNERKAAA